MSRTEDVVSAYEAWDPEQESSSQLAERIGISKARLYQILEREGITPKARRPHPAALADRVTAARRGLPESDAERLIAEMKRMLDALSNELALLRNQVAEYEGHSGSLEA